MPLKFERITQNEWRASGYGSSRTRYRVWRNKTTGNYFAYRIHADGAEAEVLLGASIADMRRAMAYADADAAFERGHRGKG